jgi:flagellar hook-length control protein FliK
LYPAPEPKGDAEIASTNDGKTAGATAVVMIAVAAPPMNVLVTDPTAGPVGSAPVESPPPAPAIVASGATPDAPIPSIGAPADITGADGIVPVAPASPVNAAPATSENDPAADESPKAPSLKAAGLFETIETKPVAAEAKPETGKPKSDQHTRIAPAKEGHSPSEAAAPKADVATEQQAKVPLAHQSQPQAAEHASPAARAAVAEPRPELPATAAAPAELNHAPPNVPFDLIAPATPLPSLWPVTALHIDPAVDNAVPVGGLAIEIVSRAQDGLRRFEIRLDPPELGRIDVRLDVDSGGKVTSRLTIERTETLDLLRRDAPQLERALQHAGLNTEGGLEFSLRDQNFANREQAPRDVPTARLIVPDDEQVAAEAARRGYGRLIGLGGGIDIRV